MTKKELQQWVTEINQRLAALGDLSELVRQGQNLSSLIPDVQAKKTDVESFLKDLPARSEELNRLTTEVKKLNEQLRVRDSEVSELSKQTEELRKKTEELIKEAKVQLGVAANAKLASTFERVKEDLETDKRKWFRWLFGIVLTFVLATALIVWWQVTEEGTLYHLSFPVRLALLSPIGYFGLFINREHSRVRNLIEEYTFKAAVARSFEAYKEIVQGADSEDSEKTFAFIVESINTLYSSPMLNIKNNNHKEREISPEPLSQIRSIIEKDSGATT